MTIPQENPLAFPAHCAFVIFPRLNLRSLATDAKGSMSLWHSQGGARCSWAERLHKFYTTHTNLRSLEQPAESTPSLSLLKHFTDCASCVSCMLWGRGKNLQTSLLVQARDRPCRCKKSSCPISQDRRRTYTCPLPSYLKDGICSHPGQGNERRFQGNDEEISTSPR